MTEPTDLEQIEEVRQVLLVMSNLSTDGLDVANDNDLAQASALLRDVKAVQKKAAEAQKALTQPLEHEKRGIIAFFRERITSKLDDYERSLKRMIVAYSQEQERIRREAQRQAEEAARKERERLAKRAAAAEAKGQAEKAEQLTEQAQTVVAPVAPPPPKVSGISSRKIARFEIVDPEAIPRSYLIPDEKKIGQVVRALKTDADIPGVRVWLEESLAAQA